jgi:DNA-cytosine methyltransferase
MNVLSTFGGIEVGRLSLKNNNIKVNKYFSSEIDEDAILVTNKNHSDIIHMGDVTKLKSSDFPKIDLLIGGSPCQGFSMAGKQLNFNDSRSKLFFEFVRLKEELNPKYFFLENVKMNKIFANQISKLLGKDFTGQTYHIPPFQQPIILL